MIVSTLIKALDKARSPGVIRGIVRGLEMTTGRSTASLFGAKQYDLVTFTPMGTDPLDAGNMDASWYLRNGYFGLATQLGSGYANYSGKLLTFDTALESSAMLAGVKMISEDIARSPLILYQRSPDGRSAIEAKGDPLYDVLRNMPNPDMNASAVYESIMVGALLAKEGYARIDRDSDGNVLYLWPLPAGSVTRDQNTVGRPFFVYKDGNAQSKTYTADQVFNVPGWSINGKTGDDILRRARHVLGLTLGTQEYAASFFARDANPGVILKRPQGLEVLGDEKIAALKRKWKDWHQGSGRAHEPAILQDGMDAVRLDPDHAKMQLVEQRKFQVIEVCRLLRMPPHKLADLDRATFSNIEQQGIDYANNTLAPWGVRFEQSAYRCLLTAKQRAAGFFAKHDLSEHTRGALGDQVAAWARLQSVGSMSQNEVRAKLGLPPVEGGDKLYIQINMGAVADAATDAALDPALNQPDPPNAPANSPKMLLPAGEVRGYLQ